MFTYYELDNAPEESKPLMEQSLVAFGMLPNLQKIMAESPAAYEAYNAAFDAFMKSSSLSPLEQQVVFMTANFENNCHYCMPGHTWMMKAGKMPEAVIEALREGRAIPDTRLQALHDYTRELLNQRGHIGDEALQRFFDAGFSKRQALDVLAGLSAKLISNYANAIAKTELDEVMTPLAWTHPAER